MTKRYSVAQSAQGAQRVASIYGTCETWDRAKVVMDSLNKYNPGHRIWHHNDDGTVTDVTDGDVEMQWWFCEWSKHKGFTSWEARPCTLPLAMNIHWLDREANFAHCYIQSATAPTAEQFQAHILAETGVTVPCVPRCECCGQIVQEKTL